MRPKYLMFSIATKTGYSAISDADALSKIKKCYGQNNLTIQGKFEKRHVSEIKINSTIISDIFNSVDKSTWKFSFSLMMITQDLKVLLLQRANSFHYFKVMSDLKFNGSLNLRLAQTLYSSELDALRVQFVDQVARYADELPRDNSMVNVLPGGMSSPDEPVYYTLAREFLEETSMKLELSKIKFNRRRIFKVAIYDFTVKKHFDNLVFPVKIDMTSQNLVKYVRDTKETRNPFFVDIDYVDEDVESSLFNAFVKIQKTMVN
jgi:hypothetical protein